MDPVDLPHAAVAAVATTVATTANTYSTAAAAATITTPAAAASSQHAISELLEVFDAPGDTFAVATHVATTTDVSPAATTVAVFPGETLGQVGDSVGARGHGA